MAEDGSEGYGEDAQAPDQGLNPRSMPPLEEANIEEEARLRGLSYSTTDFSRQLRVDAIRGAKYC